MITTLLKSDYKLLVSHRIIHLRFFIVAVTSKPIWVSNQTKVNITYEKDQLGVMYLDCRLSAGNPLPIITWIKDGYVCIYNYFTNTLNIKRLLKT